MPKPKPTTPVANHGGAAYLRRSGKRAVLVTVSESEREKLKSAAIVAKMSVTQFVAKYSLMAADKILLKSA